MRLFRTLKGERHRLVTSSRWLMIAWQERELAPWSSLIWRTHKMRRTMGSTLDAETQSLFNGLGHAEWIAAHFAEARSPGFDVA